MRLYINLFIYKHIQAPPENNIHLDRLTQGCYEIVSTFFLAFR